MATVEDGAPGAVRRALPRDGEVWAEGDEHWDDPAWVAQLRAEIDAECKEKDPEWEAAHAHQNDDHWAAALAVFGVLPFNDPDDTQRTSGAR